MNEEMNQAEIAREETEQKMIYKFLLMVKAEKEKGGNLEELEKQIMEALRESDAAPKGKAAGKAVKPATKKEAAPAEDDEKKEDLFDDTIGDDFSIEEDL